jgi:hypothetical protein
MRSDRQATPTNVEISTAHAMIAVCPRSFEARRHESLSALLSAVMAKEDVQADDTCTR